MNDDGSMAVILSDFPAGRIVVLLDATECGAGSPTFESPVAVAAGAGVQDFDTADFDGEGSVDIVASNQNDRGLGPLRRIRST
ncbi:MAG: hypothetical protein U0414_25040 [Polyangiaceae bacterium]